jgi:hypothetical protein
MLFRRHSIVGTLYLLTFSPLGRSFVVQQPVGRLSAFSLGTQLHSSGTDVESMRAGEIKKELESYGISTKSFFEKSELVEALKKARADGLTPKKETASSSTSSTQSTQSTASSQQSTSSSSSSSAPSDDRPREERIKEETEKCKTMKAGEMKKELEERGVSTKSFFEKSEFLKALVEARVDGVQKQGGSGQGSDTEGYAEYTNVEVLTDDSSGPRPKRSTEPEQQQQQQPRGGGNPFGGGGNPFGGGGNPFGGGGNPFGGGGGGGNPFG